MLTRDLIEPLTREVAHFLVICGAPVGSTWYDAGRSPEYRNREDLVPLKQQKDEDVEFIRAWHKEGRIHCLGIREQAPDPASIVIHPAITLDSQHKAGASIEIDNRNGDILSEPHIFRQEFKDGESEMAAVSLSMTNEVWATASAEASVEAGPASASTSAETGWRNTIEAAWNQQTGRTSEETTGGEFPFRAPAGAYVEGRIEWVESTKQRRIECCATLDCKVEIGRRRRYKGKWGWASGSPQTWDSIDHLIAVVEKRGRVGMALYEFFASKSLNQEQQASLERIKELRKRHVDRLTEPYTGNSDIKVVIQRLDMDDAENEGIET